MRVVDTLYAVLPLEPLERWHNVAEVSFDLAAAFLAHLDGEGDAVE